jgi:hypothetical protein
MSRVTRTALQPGREVGDEPGAKSAKQTYSFPKLKLLGSVSELTQGGGGSVPEIIGGNMPGGGNH